MRLSVLLTVFCLIATKLAFSQGTLRGKVSDENGEPLIGVVIKDKANGTLGGATDFDGNYSITIKDGESHTFEVSFISFATQEFTVKLAPNEILLKDIILKSVSIDTKEVVITATATKQKDYYMENVKKKSATTIDYVSAESMKKIGDANATAAVARVSGVSISNGFITVRGIGDRYVKTCLNGSRIPTLDPFTNNIQLDLFPSSLIDNIIITKTASPELSGDWSGAYVSVETKDYPDKLTVNVETTLGYVAQSTFKDVLTSDRSSTDWLGYDNNLRDRDHRSFVPAVTSPTTYQEFVALGLGDYYKGMGVNGSTPWNDTYFKLGLVQLGLLAPAQVNDDNAFKDAKAAYISGDYRPRAFQTMNGAAAKSGQSFSNNWNLTKRKAPLNVSQSISVGNQISLFGRPLGLLAGFRYGSTSQFDPSSVANRAALAKDPFTDQFVRTVSSEMTQQEAREVNSINALLQASYKISPNHGVSFLFMPNMIGNNKVRSSVDSREAQTLVWTKSQFYEQRKQMVYQAKSEHYLPALKTKLELNASYTNGDSKAPDFKNLQYYEDPLSQSYQIGGTIGDGIHRYFRYLSDNLLDTRIQAEFPLSDDPKLVRKAKVGAAYQENRRKSEQYDYQVLFGPYNPIITNPDLDAYLSTERFGIRSGVDNFGQPYSTIDAYYTEPATAANYTFGSSKIQSVFGMVDYSINEPFRISGGLRIEKAGVRTDVVKFDSLNYGADDPRRDYMAGHPAARPGKLDQMSYLPSINFIYKVKDNEFGQSNIRLNFSKTVARPSIRELSDVEIYDYEFRSSVFGNSDLKPVDVKNYDLRFETYRSSGNSISVSLFYKDFKNHIELINSGGYSWQNVDKSTVKGIELEGRLVLSPSFDFRSNVTLVQSETEFVRRRMEIAGSTRRYVALDTVQRTMYGQAPYIINATLGYKADSVGFNANISYNVQGPRLVITSDAKEMPDVYEMPRHMIDFKMSKKMGSHFTVSLTLRDILNTPIRRAYKYDGGYPLDYDRFRFGRTWQFSLAYKL